MIDLSFLTAEEQECIRAVLQRDAELKKTEELRVQNLQKIVSDKGRLRYLNGDWFYETKQRRHQDRIHGCDIIRASMKHAQKQETTLEMSNILPKTSSFIRDEVEEPVIVSSLLSRIHCEHERREIQNTSETLHGAPMSALQLPIKRKNPFNFGQAIEEKKDCSQELELIPAQNENLKEEWHYSLQVYANSSLNSADQESDMSVPSERQPEQCDPIQESKEGLHLSAFEATSNTEKQLARNQIFSISRQGMFGSLNTDKPAKTSYHSKNTLLEKNNSDIPADIPDDLKGETLQNTALWNNKFQDLITSSELQMGEDISGTCNIQCTEQPSNLKAHCKTQSRKNINISDTKKVNSESISKTPRKSSLTPQNESDIRSINNIVLPHFENTDTPCSSLQSVNCLFVELSNTDGTYSANPILICEETDEESSSELLSDKAAFERKAQNIKPDVPKSLNATGKDIRCQNEIVSVRSSKQPLSSSEMTNEKPCQTKTQRESQTRLLGRDKTPSSSVKQKDDVRRSPSKTCHPKVLPRDCSGNKPLKEKGCPLKTFPIDINPKINFQDENKKPLSLQKQKNFSSNTSKSVKQSSKCIDIDDFSSEHESIVILGTEMVRQDSRNYIPFRNSPRITSPVLEKKDKGSSNDIFLRTQATAGNTVCPYNSCLTKKTSASVPILQEDEKNGDNDLENNLGWRRNTSSSTSNISLSSEMASISSVSGSMSSIYNADFIDVDVQGSIQVAVNYIQKLEEFHIFVVLCRGLAVADSRRSCSDPYVKCYLLPDKTKLGKRKTTVKKKTLNPIYNEILRYKVMMEDLKTLNLNISVWHKETFGRNSFLGQVDLDLSEWDFSNTRINDYNLKERISFPTSPSDLPDSRGQMRLALRFLPQSSNSDRAAKVESGEVQIWVKDCKKLSPRRGVTIDPFVKCTVLPDTSRKSRQKTRVVKRTANPMFNHTMVYDGFCPEDLREACVEITVWDHDRMSNHYIGGLRLGLGTGKSYGTEVPWMDSTPREAELWERMLQYDSEWVEAILPLRMLVIAKRM